MQDVLIAGAGMTRFGKFPERSLRSLAEEAVDEALHDAGVSPADVDLVVSGNAMAGLMTGQEMIRGQTFLGDSGLLGLPVLNVENACASSSSAMHVGWLGIGAGEYDVVVVLGAEKMTSEDRGRVFKALASATDVERLDEYRRDLAAETGQDAGNVSADSFFMDVYAAMAERYMERTGATPRDFALAAVKGHRHGALNPKAQYRDEVTLEQVLDSRPISGPLTLMMCSPIADGAAALVLCSREFANSRAEAGNGAARVRIRATALATGRNGGEPPGPVTRAARRAYEQAGIGPEDIDLVELHDAASPSELITLEELELCGPGEAPRLQAAGDTALGGRLPVNTSGGLISKGHPVGATGCGQIVELVEQLRGRAGERQADGVEVALAENAGGYLNPDPAVCAVTILSKD